MRSIDLDQVDKIPSFEDVRENYPHPIPVDDRTGGDDDGYKYCVGGALCSRIWDLNHVGSESNINEDIAFVLDSFPERDDLALVFETYWDITTEEARRIAGHVVEANDDEEMDESWLWLEKAMSHNPREMDRETHLQGRMFV